jgi:hypothetical protein
MRDLETWTRQSEMSDPAEHVANIAKLPSEVARLNEIIQGTLVHSDWLTAHGLDGIGFSRTTLPVAERLEDILRKDGSPIENQRPPRGRSAGTCRDFALMLTSFLRCHGVPARMRCGFAAYFGDGWEDHWVCEYWDRRAHAWRLSDAQLDEVQKDRCRIDFDAADVPRRSFKTAAEAWTECLAGKSDADGFGHGETTGLWFVGVNVARDHFVLNGREISVWDRWREAPKQARTLGKGETELLNQLAADPGQPLREISPSWLPPTEGVAAT